jgi:hypothetical protein
LFEFQSSFKGRLKGSSVSIEFCSETVHFLGVTEGYCIVELAGLVYGGEIDFFVLVRRKERGVSEGIAVVFECYSK